MSPYRLTRSYLYTYRGFLAGGDPRNNGGCDVTVRVDTGVQEDGEVSIFYDPMISKLIVHASDRPRALAALSNALDRYQVSGVPTNLSFLKLCVDHEAFQKVENKNNNICNTYPLSLLICRFHEIN